jgi:predicted aspartyl protease
MFTGLLALPLAHASAADCALKKVASFDATIGSAILVKARIDDQPVSAMLDTGAPYNMLSKVTVDLLKLPMERVREGAMIDATGNSVLHLARAHSVTLGDVKTKDTPFFVMGESRPDALAPDAIFGTNFLEANDLELDLAHGKVNMFTPDHCPGQVVYWTHEFVPIPIKLMSGGHIVLPVTVNGATTNAMLDTGASLSTVGTLFAKNTLGIDPAAGDAKTGHLVAGTGARLLFYRHIFDNFDIGGIQFHNTEMEIAPDTMNRMAFNGNSDVHERLREDDVANTPVILGLAHLRKLRLYFSFRERMLYVTPANAS